MFTDVGFSVAISSSTMARVSLSTEFSVLFIYVHNESIHIANICNNSWILLGGEDPTTCLARSSSCSISLIVFFDNFIGILVGIFMLCLSLSIFPVMASCSCPTASCIMVSGVASLFGESCKLVPSSHSSIWKGYEILTAPFEAVDFYLLLSFLPFFAIVLNVFSFGV